MSHQQLGPFHHSTGPAIPGMASAPSFQMHPTFRTELLFCGILSTVVQWNSLFPPLYPSVFSWELKLLPSFLFPGSRMLGDGMSSDRGSRKEDVEKGPRAAMAPFSLCHTGLEITRWDFGITSQGQILSLHSQWNNTGRFLTLLSLGHLTDNTDIIESYTTHSTVAGLWGAGSQFKCAQPLLHGYRCSLHSSYYYSAAIIYRCLTIILHFKFIITFI